MEKKTRLNYVRDFRLELLGYHIQKRLLSEAFHQGDYAVLSTKTMFEFL